jgi:hypothetical protein
VPSSTILVNVAAARMLERLPGLKRLPLTEFVILAEIAFLAKQHYERLTPKERRRIVMIVRESGGHPSNLTDGQRREFMELISKAEPRTFAMTAAQKLSPLSLKRRR